LPAEKNVCERRFDLSRAPPKPVASLFFCPACHANHPPTSVLLFIENSFVEQTSTRAIGWRCSKELRDDQMNNVLPARYQVNKNPLPITGNGFDRPIKSVRRTISAFQILT
jgi:hypothetical protein